MKLKRILKKIFRWIVFRKIIISKLSTHGVVNEKNIYRQILYKKNIEIVTIFSLFSSVTMEFEYSEKSQDYMRDYLRGNKTIKIKPIKQKRKAIKL